MTRVRMTLFVLVCFGVLILNMPAGMAVMAQADGCGDVPAPRLTIGGFARVTAGNANNVRDVPARKGKLLGQIPGGETLKVLDGPTCADGLNWWQVAYKDMRGWTVEAAGSDYWLEPYDPAQPEVLTSPNGVDYAYEGIHFEVNPDWATTVTASHLQPVISDPNVDVPQPFAPAGIGFRFTNADGKTLPLSLRVYAVADYIKQDADTEAVFTTLSKMITKDPGWLPPSDEIPVLSIVRQPALFRARTNELSFANGSGYRFLRQTSFDVRPIINPIDYQYSGLTYDNQYYVVVQGTVTTPLLADKVDPANSGADFEKQFDAYQKEIVGKLTKAKSSEFTPTLDLLDNLIASLQIGGIPFSVTTENGLTHVAYGGIHFDVDSSLAQDVDYQIDLASWDTMSPMPEHVCFRLQADALSSSPYGPRLCIIPTEGMGDYVKSLKQILAEQPTFEDGGGQPSIPIPFGGAAQLIHARAHYMQTDAVQGVSFITRYAQMDYYIGGDTLEYNFSGLSRGGKYIIYFEKSVRTDLIGSKVPSTQQLNTLLANPAAYYQKVVGQLNAGTPADFTPNLDTLDALIQSISFN